jgi:mono/diheme cytochrome c family protein
MTNSESSLKRELRNHCPGGNSRQAGWHRWSFVIRHSSLAILFLLATGCDWMPGKPKFADRWVPDTAVTNFATLYNTHCAACHAIDGRLAAAHPLNDPVFLTLIDRAAFRHAVSNGVPGTTMPAFAQNLDGPLTETQIDLVVSSIFEKWSRPQDFTDVKPPPRRAAPGDTKRGAAVYQIFCVQCHGPDGKGGEKGGSVVDPSYLALVNDQGLRTAVIAGRIDFGMPDWRGYVPGKAMSGQEIADVVAWIASHRNK